MCDLVGRQPDFKMFHLLLNDSSLWPLGGQKTQIMYDERTVLLTH